MKYTKIEININDEPCITDAANPEKKITLEFLSLREPIKIVVKDEYTAERIEGYIHPAVLEQIRDIEVPRPIKWEECDIPWEIFQTSQYYKKGTLIRDQDGNEIIIGRKNGPRSFKNIERVKAFRDTRWADSKIR